MIESDPLDYWYNLIPGQRPTPFFLIDPLVAVKKIDHLHKILPRVDVFYAVKSLNDVRLLSAIKNQVAGFDVASLGEIQQLLNLGVEPEKILFSNPVKVPKQIEKAYKHGIRYFAFDSLSEIEKLAQYAPGSNVYLRIRVADHGSMFPLSQKFGVDPMHAVAYCSTAQDMGLNVVGLAFHVGSQSENTQAWVQAIENSAATIQRLHNAGIHIDFLDIGGGFPAYYGSPIITIDMLAEDINTALEAIPSNIKIVAEPGRHISANSAVIVTEVIGRERRQGRDWLYIDVGAFQGIIEPLEMSGWRYPIVNFDNRNSNNLTSFVLTGPTCDACDTLGDDYLLPANTNIGDRLIIGSAGAYTVVYESSFNGFEPMPRIYIGNQSSMNEHHKRLTSKNNTILQG